MRRDILIADDHPLFAQAWVQKLCAYANSVPCQAGDPEFQRVVGVFQSSGLSWNALLIVVSSACALSSVAPGASRPNTLMLGPLRGA